MQSISRLKLGYVKVLLSCSNLFVKLVDLGHIECVDDDDDEIDWFSFKIRLIIIDIKILCWITVTAWYNV